MPNSEKEASHVGLICHNDKNGLALIPSHVSSNSEQLPMHIFANNAFHYQLAGILVNIMSSKMIRVR